MEDKEVKEEHESMKEAYYPQYAIEQRCHLSCYG